jgi:hypothetical protein
VQGLIGAVALAQLASTGNASLNGVVAVAIGMGIAAAVFAAAGEWLSSLARWFYSALGLVAAVPAVVAFVRSNGCLHGPPPLLRFLAVLLLAAVAGLTFAASFLMSRRLPASATGLALYGSLQILIAAATFIAGNESSGNLLALTAMVVGAALLGWFVVKHGEAVLGVAGVAFGMQSIYAAAAGGGCGGTNYSGAVLLIVFCGAYFATRAVCAPFGARR